MCLLFPRKSVTNEVEILHGVFHYNGQLTKQSGVCCMHNYAQIMHNFFVFSPFCNKSSFNWADILHLPIS